MNLHTCVFAEHSFSSSDNINSLRTWGAGRDATLPRKVLWSVQTSVSSSNPPSPSYSQRTALVFWMEWLSERGNSV